MPKNVGYAWTGNGLISRDKIQKKQFKSLPSAMPPEAPGIKTEKALKIDRRADKYKRKG